MSRPSDAMRGRREAGEDAAVSPELSEVSISSGYAARTRFASMRATANRNNDNNKRESFVCVNTSWMHRP